MNQQMAEQLGPISPEACQIYLPIPSPTIAMVPMQFMWEQMRVCITKTTP